MKKICIMICLMPLQVFAQPTSTRLPGIHKVVKAVALVPRGPTVEECDITLTGDTRCDDRYKRLLSDGTINVTLSRGYGDRLGSVSDDVVNEYYENQLTLALTGPCPSSFTLIATEIPSVKSEIESKKCVAKTSYQESCGFERGDDPEIFTKKIMVRGKVVDVKIRIVDGALSGSDSKNRKSQENFIKERICQTASNPPLCLTNFTPPKASIAQLVRACQPGDIHRYQICRSEHARKTWLDSIVNGDEIVMYSGHARKGGGPSFDPPRVLKNGHVDYPWYESTREGHKQETEAFKLATKNSKTPVLYASLSCSSKDHFMKNGNFPEVSPTTAFILSERLAYTDEGVASALSTLDSTFGGKCEKEFSKSLQGASCAYNLNNF